MKAWHHIVTWGVMLGLLWAVHLSSKADRAEQQRGLGFVQWQSAAAASAASLLDARVAALELEREKVDGRLKSVEYWSLKGTYRRVPVNSTGAEVCASFGETCLGLRSGATYLSNSDKFWGYSTISCQSRLKLVPGCSPTSDYSFEKTEFQRHPESKVAGTSSGPLCLGTPFYDFAVCLTTPREPK